MSTVIHSDNTSARRLTNKSNAFSFATLGLGVFVSDGKVPLIPRYNRWDHEITADERERAIEEYAEKHDGQQPIHVGCTKDKEVLKRMFRAFPDAVPSIACGPSKLVVLDADSKDNGPELLKALFAEHGGVPTGTPVIPTRSGGQHLIFSDPEGHFTNKAGQLKKQFGTDVRGTGGQFIAPGSMRVDGKTYGTNDDKLNFLRAIHQRSIPPLPDFVAEKIGAIDPSNKDEVAPTKEREVIKSLQDDDITPFENAFDAVLGDYDLDKLKQANAEFAELYDNPSPDCSTNRFLAARMVMTEWPHMPVQALATFFEDWDGAGTHTVSKPATGEYDDRQIAREWLKNQGLSKQSTGEAFGTVRDDDMDDRAAFLANGGTVESWDVWQDRLAREHDERLARAGRKAAAVEGQSAGRADRLSERFTYVENIRGAAVRLLDWIVKHVIARGTTSVATGMWGAGKTAVYSDIGLHVGHGFEWCGRKVKKGVVIYVALENSEDVERRVAAWLDLMERAGRDVSEGAFVVHKGPCGLFDPNGRPTRDEKDLIEIAGIASEHYGLPVAMIVIDTLAQSIAPGDDNSAKDAGIFTAAMQRIVNATGANVTALAHPVKGSGNGGGGVGVRGSGAFQANLDTVVEIAMDEKSRRGTVKAGSKFRIGNPRKVSFGYRLDSHVIATDGDGEDVEVVLATARANGAMPPVALDEDEDVPPMKRSDTHSDRIEMLLSVMRAEAEKLVAQSESVETIPFAPAEVTRVLNVERAMFARLDGTPLAPLVRKAVWRVMRAAVDAGRLKEDEGKYFLLE